jgi:hypothetical protein
VLGLPLSPSRTLYPFAAAQVLGAHVSPMHGKLAEVWPSARGAAAASSTNANAEARIILWRAFARQLLVQLLQVLGFLFSPKIDFFSPKNRKAPRAHPPSRKRDTNACIKGVSIRR